MDFEDMDAKIKANNIHVAVFVALIIHVDEYGRSVKLRKQWRFIKQMTAL